MMRCRERNRCSGSRAAMNVHAQPAKRFRCVTPGQHPKKCLRRTRRSATQRESRNEERRRNNQTAAFRVNAVNVIETLMKATTTDVMV